MTVTVTKAFTLPGGGRKVHRGDVLFDAEAVLALSSPNARFVSKVGVPEAFDHLRSQPPVQTPAQQDDERVTLSRSADKTSS